LLLLRSAARGGAPDRAACGFRSRQQAGAAEWREVLRLRRNDERERRGDGNTHQALSHDPPRLRPPRRANAHNMGGVRAFSISVARSRRRSTILLSPKLAMSAGEDLACSRQTSPKRRRVDFDVERGLRSHVLDSTAERVDDLASDVRWFMHKHHAGR